MEVKSYVVDTNVGGTNVDVELNIPSEAMRITKKINHNTLMSILRGGEVEIDGEKYSIPTDETLAYSKVQVWEDFIQRITAPALASFDPYRVIIAEDRGNMEYGFAHDIIYKIKGVLRHRGNYADITLTMLDKGTLITLGLSYILGGCKKEKVYGIRRWDFGWTPEIDTLVDKAIEMVLDFSKEYLYTIVDLSGWDIEADFNIWSNTKAFRDAFKQQLAEMERNGEANTNVYYALNAKVQHLEEILAHYEMKYGDFSIEKNGRYEPDWDKINRLKSL